MSADGVVIGTRGSRLAMWQARHIRALLEGQGVSARLEVIQTRGDRIDDIPFSKMEGKGFFTKELEDAQLDGRVDLAVHSMKDMTTSQPAGLVIGAMVGREDPRDLLLALPSAVDADAVARGEALPLKTGARVGTSSARRQAQARALAPDVVIGDLRGNVPTRVQRLRDGQHDAILIANAGVLRLDLSTEGLVAIPLDPEAFIPAPAQGMLALQCRDEPAIVGILAKIHTADAARPVEAERWLLQKLEGGCQLPFGCYVRAVDAGGFALDLFLQVAGRAPVRIRDAGPDPMALAEAAWEQLVPYRAQL